MISGKIETSTKTGYCTRQDIHEREVAPDGLDAVLFHGLSERGGPSTD